MKCPQCGTKMQSERSATPLSSWSRTMLETRHYRCDGCDAEFVKGEGKGLIEMLPDGTGYRFHDKSEEADNGSGDAQSQPA